MKRLTERQQTGAYFTILGIVLLSFWPLSYRVIDLLIINHQIVGVDIASLTDEQQYMLGVTAVVALQLISLTGIPFLIAGIVQLITGRKK